VGRERGRCALLRNALLALALILARRAPAEEFTIQVKDPTVRTRAELDLFLNDAPAGTALTILEGGDAFVLPSDLQRAGVAVRGGTRATVDDRELVSLKSLGPALQFTVDEKALALRITAPAELLGTHVLDLANRVRPAELQQRFDSSAFLDYAVDSDLRGAYGLSFQGGGRVGPWLLTTDLYRSMFTGDWSRGTTSAVRDDIPALQRLTVGDTLAATGTLGGGALVGGVSIAREWSLDPYLVRAPYPATTAIVTAPSTLQVFVNGTMVRQQTIGPGYWDVTNLPVGPGQALVQTVVRDAFGRERSFDSRFYFSGGLLAPGYSDYAFSAGFKREAFGEESFEYGPPAATARYRQGISDWLTPEVRAEASNNVVSAGAGATVGTRVGELQLDGSVSGASRGAGEAGLLGWSVVTGRWSTSLRVLAQTDHYANLSLGPTLDRAVLDAAAAVGTVVSRIGLTAEVRGGRYRDAGRYATAGLRGSVQVGRASLMLSGDYGNDLGGRTGLQLMATLTWSLGRHSGDATVSCDRSGNVVSGASVQRPLLKESSVGYRLHATGGEVAPSGFDGTLQGQTSFGRAELDGARSNGIDTWHANASGGVVYIDRGVHFTRPTGGSFALVDAGVRDVGVTAENIPVGKTGADGKLLVPELLPYYATRLALVDRDIPLEYEPGRTVGWYAAPYQGGAVARFELRRISAITGQLTVEVRGEAQRPANGELSVIVDGELRRSPITDAGRFFLERMPPGKHVVQAVWGGGSCRAAITLPEDAPPVFDAGEVRCILDTLDPSGKLPSLRDPNYADFPPPPPADRAGLGAGSGGGVR
jgi:outer membrane usher protein